MKLRIYTYLLSVARRLVGELEWRVIYHTPVGPNPHEPNTLEYLLFENGNRLCATHHMKALDVIRCPWIGLIGKAQWPDQMGDTVKYQSFER